eukprot:TRINITY_DN1277_c0_g1_i1.p1 TRINITY_DN1277_c0_g1~~TRINITY_DN1277_c0_g1_i1.p1  ORF type:complete len:705 (+),score=110.99 TRINITY_DN1277_c0_g1_i1:47-2161(+)
MTLTAVQHAAEKLRTAQSHNRAEGVLRFVTLFLIFVLAFATRLFSVLRYESVIHEFDPYFNFRSTKYLVEHGFYNFLNWFDSESWYPLGRIVGGTVYPGLMWTGAFLHSFFNAIHFPIDIRNICVFIAPFFSSLTALCAYFMTKEVRSTSAGLMAAAFMAIVPGYISRSVAGSFDNEGIAIFALLFTYTLWIKSVNTGSLFYSALTSLAYFYMVSAWGGYVFIINLIPLYVFVMLISGRYSHRLYIAYSTLYVLGTLLSMQITFVGFQPVQSSEHMAALGMFCLLQVYCFLNWIRSMLPADHLKMLFRLAVLSVIGLGVLVVFLGLTTGYITPWTGRFYNLLDPTYAKNHIPIIASVSEHQPTTWSTFFFDMHVIILFFPAGVYYCFRDLSDGTLFLICYALTSVYFAGVMVRLILVLAPISCIVGAIGASSLLKSHADAIMNRVSSDDSVEDVVSKPRRENSLLVVCAMSLFLAFYTFHCTWVTSEAYSSPSIVLAARQSDGSQAIFDDFRESYYWLRQNTASDARVMSWWDYGYQLSAMANRTILVDNNTWNNSHIAQVGKAFASSEPVAYQIVRSLDVDYVLILFGGVIGYASDDINKFLWMVRIAGSTDPSIKEADYFSKRGEYRMDEEGSPTMLNCLMYKMSYYRFGDTGGYPGNPSGYDRVRQVEIRRDIKLEHFEEVYTSEHWLVRIYRVRKPANRA